MESTMARISVELRGTQGGRERYLLTFEKVTPFLNFLAMKRRTLIAA